MNVTLGLKDNFLTIHLTGMEPVSVRLEIITDILNRTSTNCIDLCNSTFIKIFSADLSFGMNFSLLFTCPTDTDGNTVIGTWKWFNVPVNILTNLMKDGKPRTIRA